MSRLRLVWGAATGPTAMAAYDAALAEANVHEYNLVSVSSVIPAAPPLSVVGTAPDLGPTGNRLTVVQSRQTLAPQGEGKGKGESEGEGKGESEGEGEGESELEGEREGGPDAGVAAVGWARSEAGPGIFYEASGTDAQAVRATVEEGLAAGVALRDWEPVETDVVLRQVEPAADAHATVVVLATYGDSTPLL